MDGLKKIQLEHLNALYRFLKNICNGFFHNMLRENAQLEDFCCVKKGIFFASKISKMLPCFKKCFS